MFLLWIPAFVTVVQGFSPFNLQTQRKEIPVHYSSSGDIVDKDNNLEVAEDDLEIQWDLFKKHHAKGSYKGVWTSYDYIGDVIDETIASVNLDYDESDDSIMQTHTIVVGAKKADCATCFDSFETKVLPVAKYTQQELRKTRLGSVGMINGPTLLRSGAMATELVLSYGDGRVRVVFQHAPVWPAHVEPGSGPPSGLKLFRTMVSREATRDKPPTFESEAENPPSDDDPIFFRGVPPFKWHMEWAGTSWTWGPQAGNRGWQVERMEEVDAWHGRPTGDGPNVWNLRLPGGVMLQCPRIVSNDETGIFRIAWLPRNEILLRLEAGVMALQPMLMEDDTLVSFYPPTLAALRCDLMKKTGELPDLPKFLKHEEEEAIKPKSDEEFNNTLNEDENDENNDSGLDAVRAALKL
mmetsp:Transcript_24157/g.36729  ORF Transcript_24157/g.36729 Transcript_24157/m.36729 type:complete len:409 (-) Transcript_24157:1671-2897(-)